jgi:hypothetical protein
LIFNFTPKYPDIRIKHDTPILNKLLIKTSTTKFVPVTIEFIGPNACMQIMPKIHSNLSNSKLEFLSVWLNDAIPSIIEYSLYKFNSEKNDI